MPGHISASTLVDLDDDPASVVARLRRPVPREPGMSARKGTAFHAWVEEYFGTAGMLDLGEAAGSDDHIDEAYGLDAMVETFRRSEWAHRAPAHVEVPVETRIGDVVVRGRIDAVFRDADGRWDLVDWKTGRRPAAGQLKTRAVQLAVYRLAWSRLKGVPLEDVRAAFYYVADDAVVRPHDLGSAERLEEIVAAAFGEYCGQLASHASGADPERLSVPWWRCHPPLTGRQGKGLRPVGAVSGVLVLGGTLGGRGTRRAAAVGTVVRVAGGVGPARCRAGGAPVVLRRSGSLLAGDRRDLHRGHRRVGGPRFGPGPGRHARIFRPYRLHGHGGLHADGRVRCWGGLHGHGGLGQWFDADRLAAVLCDVVGQHRQHGLCLVDHGPGLLPRGP